MRCDKSWDSMKFLRKRIKWGLIESRWEIRWDFKWCEGWSEEWDERWDWEQGSKVIKDGLIKRLVIG